MVLPILATVEQKLKDAVLKLSRSEADVETAKKDILLLSEQVNIIKEYEAELDILKAEIKLLKKV